MDAGRMEGGRPYSDMDGEEDRTNSGEPGPGPRGVLACLGVTWGEGRLQVEPRGEPRGRPGSQVIAYDPRQR